jgi:hypothetical protein
MCRQKKNSRQPCIVFVLCIQHLLCATRPCGGIDRKYGIESRSGFGLPACTSNSAKRLSGASQSHASWRVLAPAAVAIAVCLAVAPNIERRVHAASYVETAVATHRSYLNGDLHPGLESSSPEQVTAWFAGKVPFDFRLPAAESAPERNPAYRLTGATLVHYKRKPRGVGDIRNTERQNQSSYRFQQVCRSSGWGRGPLRQADLSLLQQFRLQSDHMEQSRSLVCVGFVGIWPGPHLLSRLSSEHGRQ